MVTFCSTARAPDLKLHPPADASNYDGHHIYMRTRAINIMLCCCPRWCMTSRLGTGRLLLSIGMLVSAASHTCGLVAVRAMQQTRSAELDACLKHGHCDPRSVDPASTF